MTNDKSFVRAHAIFHFSFFISHLSWKGPTEEGTMDDKLLGRRGFLRDASLFSILAQVSWPRFLKAAPGRNGWAGSVYARLGVRPLINAAGTYTTLSACVMPREVRKAMEEAGAN